MKSWPDGHGFVVHELKISDVWMIDFYGGGGEVNLVRARARLGPGLELGLGLGLGSRLTCCAACCAASLADCGVPPACAAVGGGEMSGGGGGGGGGANGAGETARGLWPTWSGLGSGPG